MRKLTFLFLMLVANVLVVSAQNTVDTAIELVEGVNTVDTLRMGEPVRWYKATARSMQRTKIVFTGYPVMQVYLGSNLAQSLGFNNPIDYINEGDEQDIYICMQSTNNQALEATLSYLPPVADLSQFGTLAFSIEKNGDVEEGSGITVSFPQHVGGLDEDVVTLNYYIFSIKGGNPDGAPINLGGQTVATGTLGEGVKVDIPSLSIGKKYRLAVQSLNCGSHYAPGINEQTVGNSYVDFYYAEATGISDILRSEGQSLRSDDESLRDANHILFNLAGQRVSGVAKGIVILNGKKYVK